MRIPRNQKRCGRLLGDDGTLRNPNSFSLLAAIFPGYSPFCRYQRVGFYLIYAAMMEDTLKQLLVGTTTALIIGLTASNAVVAQEREMLKSKFLANFAGAMVASRTCKSWKMNEPELGLLMGYLHITTKDISPGGSDWPVFQASLLKAKTDSEALDANAMCQAAEGLFGPKGTAAPNLMIPADSKPQ